MNNTTDQSELQHAIGSIGWKLSHEVSNTKTSDGRIALCNEESVSYSVTVSPYSELFWSNIEDGVKESIKRLVERGYLTMSSCEGHLPIGAASYRIYLAFVSIEARSEFIDYLRGRFGVWNIFTQLVEHESLCNLQTTPQGIKIVDAKHLVNANTKREEVKSCNTTFHRHEQFYCFVELKIFDIWKKLAKYSITRASIPYIAVIIRKLRPYAILKLNQILANLPQMEKHT